VIRQHAAAMARYDWINILGLITLALTAIIVSIVLFTL
jgi:hypothetical protein